jgi:threonine dehydratase
MTRPEAPLPLVPLDDIRGAAGRIAGIARRTPLVSASADPRRAGLWLKCENLQAAGAFKIRGAANMLRQLPRDKLDSGVITYSSGNHGQGVACAARLMGAPAVVVMPTTAPEVKIAGARSFGAEVVFAGTTTTDRQQEAERIAALRGLTIVPPFDHPWIIAGQGTIGLELLEDVEDLAAVFVPIGGGGLVSGIAAAVKRLAPAVRVVGVEPRGSAAMAASLAAGRPVTLERTHSIADGLLPLRPGDLTFAHVRALVDDIVLVEDEEIADAVGWLARESHLVAEPSGAASVAAARREGTSAKGSVVAIISGGNIAADRLAGLIRSQESGVRSQESGVSSQ